MKLKIFGGLLVILAVSITAFYLINAPNPNAVSYPSPNGFDTLVDASQKMTPVPADFDSSQDVTKLNAYLDENQDPLTLLDQASGQQFLVRLSQNAEMDTILDQAGQTRKAIRLLYTRARVEALEQRPDDAGETMADIAVIGRRLGNGGLLIHQQMAIAIERMGLEGIAQIESQLSADLKQKIAKRIEDESAGQLDLDQWLDEIRTREFDNTKRQHGTIAGAWMIWQLGDSEVTTKPFDHLRSRVAEIETMRKDLITQLREVPN